MITTDLGLVGVTEVLMGACSASPPVKLWWLRSSRAALPCTASALAGDADSAPLGPCCKSLMRALTGDCMLGPAAAASCSAASAFSKGLSSAPTHLQGATAPLRSPRG